MSARSFPTPLDSRGWRRAVAVLAVMAALALSVGPSTAAQEVGGGESPASEAVTPVDQSLEAMGSVPWYDPESRGVAPVQVRPRVDDSVNRNSRWLPQPSQQSPSPANPSPAPGSSPSASGPGRISGAEILGWVLVATLMILVVGLLVYAFLRIEGSEAAAVDGTAAPQEREADFQSRLENLPVEVRRPSGDLLEEADRLAAAGQLDEAIIYLFGHRLLQLDRHHVIRLARGKTNRQYLAELYGRGDLRSVIRETVEIFEASYFGRHPIAPEHFERVRGSQSRFESLLASVREAA